MPTYGYNAGQMPYSQAPGSTMKSNGGPIQSPGNNLTNPGYSEQAFEYTQKRLMEDPYADAMRKLGESAGQQSQGEQYINQNLGSLQGPGQGEQYWNQVQGQYMDPFAGEQFAREATQNFAAQGPASAFNQQAMGDHYGAYTNYSTGNAQGQYGQSSQQLAGGTMGENTMGQLLSQAGTNANYGGPNRAASQYEQTQGAFGELPIANFDPFFDRAIQLGTQDYNRQTAGRGVYGSSEALSGVGNIITDLNAQRALKGFDAEMQRAQEQRARQQLLGEQARMGDLSGIEGFKASLQGTETYGNLAKDAGQLELDRHALLGSMANNADTQATSAQNARTDALAAFGTISNNADRAETDRYRETTNAMNQADQTQLERMNAGADVAFKVDDTNRANYDSEAAAANNSANIRDQRKRTTADIYDTASGNDLDRLRETNNQAGSAERDRQARQIAKLNATGQYSNDVMRGLSQGMDAFYSGDKEAWNDYFESALAPALQDAGFSQQDIAGMRQDAALVINALTLGAGGGGGGASGGGARPLDPNPY